MKKSMVLFQQHTGRMFRDKWNVQGKRILTDTGALKELRAKGIPVVDANDIVKETFPDFKLDIDSIPPKAVNMDENQEKCFKYLDHNVLIGGLDQAKVFTNSCEMDLNVLPISDSLNNIQHESSHNDLVKSYIRSSLLFDGTQQKLPIRKDPERPAFKFPRDYGITDRRKNFLLGKRLLQLCLTMNPKLLEKRRLVAGPINFQTAINRDSKNILLSISVDELITSDVSLKSILEPSIVKDEPLPDILPLSPYVSLEEHPFYSLEDVLPINHNFANSQIHTILLHFNRSEVSNLYETEVTETQILGRSLMKCYTVALAYARHRFGKDVSDLPEPVTVQCVQTDSQKFYFSVLQLNTAAYPNATDIRNAYWVLPTQTLFETCDYVEAKPELIGYNPQIFHTLHTFLMNN